MAVAAALATAGTGLVAVSAHGADTTATSLAIRAVKTHVKPGAADRITGALVVHGDASSAGRTVTLEEREAGQDQFTPIGAAVTGPRGGLGLQVQPAATTRYRWVFAGDDVLRASHSGVVVVHVKQPQHRPVRLHTSLSVRAAKSHVTVTGWDTISGRLRSRGVPLRRKLVVLLSKADGATTWSFAGARRTKARGQVAYRVRPQAGTRYRLAFLGSPRFRQARSGVVHVAVRANSLTIKASPRRLDPGSSTTVSGVLSHLGSAYAGQNVELRAEPRGSHAFATVDSATSGPDGSVSFTVTPTVATKYVLVLPATATGVTWTRSSVVKVTFKAKTSLSVRGRTTRNGYVVSGQLRGGGHALHRRIVSLQTLGTDGWTAVATKRTNRHGRVSFLRPASTGGSYRLVFAGGSAYAASTSGTVVH